MHLFFEPVKMLIFNHNYYEIPLSLIDKRGKIKYTEQITNDRQGLYCQQY